MDLDNVNRRRNRMRLRIHPHVAVAACLAALLLAGTVPRASAQTVTGTIFGKVVDADGLPMPGATVNISSRQLIGGTQSPRDRQRR
jgi:hypothetical protein